MKGYIYKIISPTNKVYIGQTLNTNKRFYFYKKGHCKTQTALYNSIKYHGWENHRVEILEEIENNSQDSLHDTLNMKEEYYISLYGTLESGLNCTGGGKSGKKSEETKKRMSEAAKGRPGPKGVIRSQETRDKIRKSLIGRKHSEERKRNQSLAHLGKPSPKKGKTYKIKA